MSGSIDNDDVAFLTAVRHSYQILNSTMEKILSDRRENMLSVLYSSALVGIDWAKDSGYNRGDVISRQGNVTYLRFKTVGSE